MQIAVHSSCALSRIDSEGSDVSARSVMNFPQLRSVHLLVSAFYGTSDQSRHTVLRVFLYENVNVTLVRLKCLKRRQKGTMIRQSYQGIKQPKSC